MALIIVSDLQAFEPDMDTAKATALIEDAVAMASLVAPCLVDDSEIDPVKQAAAKAILRAAILRWHTQGQGALQQQSVGPFGVTYDTRQGNRGLFWPSEIVQLQGLCGSGNGGQSAFTFSFAPQSSHEVSPNSWLNIWNGEL